MVTDDELRALASRVVGVDGVVGVVLGGSRAREEHGPDSDFDIGIYYRRPLDIDGLRGVARQVAGPAASLTEPGEWGPWVDGGGWLHIGSDAVDWIYRDLDRVQRAWRDAQRGAFYFHGQVGHPLGVPDFAYAGEVALAEVLADPTGELLDLRRQTRIYPPELSVALVDRLPEATFLIGGARKATGRGDTAYVAGCLFGVVGVLAHALHGRARRWLINEKGAAAAAGRLDIAPRRFGDRAHELLGFLGRSEAELVATLEDADRLVADTVEACRRRR
jgi:hypothetical protein